MQLLLISLRDPAALALFATVASIYVHAQQSVQANLPPIVNGHEFVADDHYRVASGWTTEAPALVALDDAIFHSGRTSVVVRHGSERASNNAGSTYVLQYIRAEPYRGRRIQYRGFLRLEKVVGTAQLVLEIEQNTAPVRLGRDQMEGRRPSGTVEWREYSCVLDVPTSATAISFGFELEGSGVAWLDDVTLQVVDRMTPVTQPDNGIGSRPPRPETAAFLARVHARHSMAEAAPKNLGFEDR